MIEEILIFAIKFENCLPPVSNKSNTGWWPHYDLDFPDPDKKIIEGDIEVYLRVIDWLRQIPKYDQRVLYAYLGNGYKVTDEEAARKLKVPKLSLINCGSYREALKKVEAIAGDSEIKDIYKRYLI